MSNGKYVILACDGGGIRGLISTMLLGGLDASVLDAVDLYAGTSTGSIIALGLASGLPIATIQNLYGSANNCSTIFTPYLSASERNAARALFERRLQAALAVPAESTAGGIPWNTIWQKIVEIAEELAFPMYSSSGLQGLLSDNFPDKTLAQLTPSVVVPSFQIDNGASPSAPWQAQLFHNLPGLSGPDLSGTSLIDTAMSSAAAPLYFEPHALSGYGRFADGGVFANNPSAAALAALIGSGVLAQKGLTLQDVVMISVGTGIDASSYPPPDSVLPYGILGWLWPKQDGPAPSFPLSGAMFDGTSQINDMVSGMLLSPGNYFRINVPLTSTVSLDDCSAIPTMISATETYMATSAWQQTAAAIAAAVGS